MQRLHRILLLPLVLGLVASPSFAKHRKKEAKAKLCPVCSMALATKKSDANPTAVKIGKKTFYCCDKCDMSSLNKKKDKNEKKGDKDKK
jgi:hypothetical protein